MTGTSFPKANARYEAVVNANRICHLAIWSRLINAGISRICGSSLTSSKISSSVHSDPTSTGYAHSRLLTTALPKPISMRSQMILRLPSRPQTPRSSRVAAYQGHEAQVLGQYVSIRASSGHNLCSESSRCGQLSQMGPRLTPTKRTSARRVPTKTKMA